MVLVPGRICREDICLLNDFAFKYHVMQDCEVSKYILKILLNEEIQDIEILDKERLGRVQLSKTYYADYVAYVNQDTDLHMEMQNRREDFDIDRILHYLARLIDKDMMKGEGYHGNRKIVIWFHNYVMPENQGLVKDYNILDSPLLYCEISKFIKVEKHPRKTSRRHEFFRTTVHLLALFTCSKAQSFDRKVKERRERNK